MIEFQLGHVYKYATIKEAHTIGISMIELGSSFIGEHFIKLKDRKERVVSFVMVSSMRNQIHYRCIYSDFDLKDNIDQKQILSFRAICNNIST